MIKVPRFTWCLLISAVLMILAYNFREAEPLISVSLYKAHLMSLGGWCGYWLDRVAFPYGRPHVFDNCDEKQDAWPPSVYDPLNEKLFDNAIQKTAKLNFASIRRAIIIAASLICVGIGA